MARQKMISTSKLGEIIDLMRDKRVAKITIPDTVEIVLFEPTPDYNGIPVDTATESGENKPMTDKELLLHSAG